MKKSQTILRLTFLIGILFILLITSCGGELSSPPEILSTNPPANTTEQASDPGFEEAELPEDFPDSFPLPADTRVGSKVNPGAGGMKVYLSLRGPLQEVLDFYHEELPAAGWLIISEDVIQGSPRLKISNPDYQGQLIFISAESGIGLEVSLFPPESVQEVPEAPENMGESTTLGKGEGDFPEDFPLPTSFQPIQLSPTLANKGFLLAFSYPGMPELALADLTMALVNAEWTVGDPSLEGNLRAYRVPFEDPATGFQGSALISNDPAAVGDESQGLTIIAYQAGE